jgi:hypothetical protein
MVNRFWAGANKEAPGSCLRDLALESGVLESGSQDRQPICREAAIDHSQGFSSGLATGQDRRLAAAP